MVGDRLVAGYIHTCVEYAKLITCLEEAGLLTMEYQQLLPEAPTESHLGLAWEKHRRAVYTGLSSCTAKPQTRQGPTEPADFEFELSGLHLGGKKNPKTFSL